MTVIQIGSTSPLCFTVIDFSHWGAHVNSCRRFQALGVPMCTTVIGVRPLGLSLVELSSIYHPCNSQLHNCQRFQAPRAPSCIPVIDVSPPWGSDLYICHRFQAPWGSHLYSCHRFPAPVLARELGINVQGELRSGMNFWNECPGRNGGVNVLDRNSRDDSNSDVLTEPIFA